MNKAFYIVGIVLAVIFMILGGYYSELVSDAKWASIFSSFSYSDYGYNYGYDSGIDDDYTVEMGLWSLLFFLSFITVDLLGLIKVKTKTVKILSIIGLSLSGIFLLWNFGMISSPGSLSFDELYPAWVFYSMVMLAFGVVGLIQSIRFEKHKNAVHVQPLVEVKDQSKDLLDS